MDVGGWLRRLGLEQYEAAFRENEVDEGILPRLTAEDLKDLGVSIVGHRRKLLDAITALRTVGDAELPSESIANTSWSSGLGPAGRAERRQITVMFSDLVGSTALSVRMDPEDLREVISAYQRCVAETVRRFGGFVAKYLGDGVLVYSVIRKRTRMTLSGLCARDWKRLLQLPASNRSFPCKPASASPRAWWSSAI
ncbi:adenylate/guanylate cyclase domain-containing protein [Bradyrhizobium canariense]|uniref:SAM domain (Sterile alpha motif) n=1 Tax=Bradyrhizobium canariense TaxID=255045 RepID=A0A1X3GTK7_9BRAD|nr:adenylate/guanylate cyclase domain-containing protein [Bradyrhizobium canariense]OSI96669.1 hypothetical protein BSZ25_01575 [Bradyrhizobium canariense]OSI98394.1 hypothetical protein BSZ24_01635 [Bradyrhizobium canariense]OSJ15818.1 hypothetical protein BSZ16_01730 [Bradyrhizobium canariense]OSJ18410.1 hypothetical protein BSZ18_02360 [Bradyrhizobium canariense]